MANYNCSDSNNSAYGAGSYNNCSQSVGAPNTGVFQELVAGGSLTILAPLVGVIIVVVIAAVVMKRRKNNTTDKTS